MGSTSVFSTTAFSNRSEWIGLENYDKFFHDPLDAGSDLALDLFAVGTTIPVLILPLLIAVLLKNAGVFTKPFRVIYFLPLVTSPVAAAAVWKWLYAKDFGLINYGLQQDRRYSPSTGSSISTGRCRP